MLIRLTEATDRAMEVVVNTDLVESIRKDDPPDVTIVTMESGAEFRVQESIRTIMANVEADEDKGIKEAIAACAEDNRGR